MQNSVTARIARVAASFGGPLGGEVSLDLREKTLVRWLAARITGITAYRSWLATNGFRSGAANGLRSWAADWLAAVSFFLEATKQAGFGLRGDGGADDSKQGNSQNRTDHLNLQVGGSFACATRRGNLRRF